MHCGRPIFNGFSFVLLFVLALMQSSAKGQVPSSTTSSQTSQQLSTRFDPNWSVKFDGLTDLRIISRVYWKRLGSKKKLIDDYVAKTGGVQNLIIATRNSKETDELLLKDHPDDSFLRNCLSFDEGMLEVAQCRATREERKRH